MQYIAIKEEEHNGKVEYIISAIPLKNTNKDVVQKIPHPLGSDSLSFDTLDEAKDSIMRAGFSYILPNGEKGHKITKKRAVNSDVVDYEHFVYNSIRNKVDSSNANVSAAAVMALSEFPTEETFDILFDKIGEDNDLIRKNAIAGICRYSAIVSDKIISSLKSPNWVVRNSILICIQNIVEMKINIDLAQFIVPLSKVCEDSNTIVQANALVTLAKVYQLYKKQKKV